MLLRSEKSIPSSEITPQSVYRNRRQFMAAAAAAGLGAVAGSRLRPLMAPPRAEAATKLQTVPSPLSTKGLTNTAFADITGYNNYYEFGINKGDPSHNAGKMQTYPWHVSVEGLVQKPRTFAIDDLWKLRPMEDRVYRFRCVEGWSMVIPWNGYSLSELLKECNPLPSAKYVQFLTLADPRQMPGLNEASLETGISWPYSEGLRMDEAMHPLTLLTFGLYGETLPNQDGAPVRIIVPWKYGFKSSKAIVKIKFTDKQPPTTWNTMAPNEYGFYSNVNPNVDHPRWSQKTERVIGAPVWKARQPTLMFNGYADQVASLYSGMDLKRYF